jgi:hypothetical protein
MSKYYLAIEYTEEPDDYFLFTSLHLAVRFIQEEDLDNFVLTDQPFLDENDKEIPTREYKFIG